MKSKIDSMYQNQILSLLEAHERVKLVGLGVSRSRYTIKCLGTRTKIEINRF